MEAGLPGITAVTTTPVSTLAASLALAVSGEAITPR